MINTIRYVGEGEVEKDGKKEIIQIHPAIILKDNGAFIQVSITHPRIIQEKLKSRGENVPAITVNALIDTGASGCVITSKVADKLNLLHTGYQTVSSVQDEQLRPVFFGFIIFPWGSGKEIQLVSCPLKKFDCLIGRDILMHWYFTYNGKDGSIVICD
ncbi:MAG: aspartyl protease family protein [candidate division Zixibacteria bacterium]|nr:aspartyl protease family protein [Candidatus Tariuqbacter arcticus]